MNTKLNTKCDRCKNTISASERAKAWPVALGLEYVCPSCYGDEAFCAEGHTLRGDNEDSECAACAARHTVGQSEATGDAFAVAHVGDFDEGKTMNTKYIANDIAIDLSKSEYCNSNGKTGDQRVELWVGLRVDVAAAEWWLETNGGPRVISPEETYWACSIEQAAEALGCTTAELHAQMENRLYSAQFGRDV